MRHPVWALPILLTACVGGQRAFPLTDGLPSASSPITLDPGGTTVWVVNPDADSVTAIDTLTLRVRATLAVGAEPWSVAVAEDGRVVVANRAAGSLSLLENGARMDVAIGPEPGGVALSPSGRVAYVSVSGADEVAAVNLETRAVARRSSGSPCGAPSVIRNTQGR